MRGDVFIVDDNLSNLQLLEKLLSENQYRVRMANSGRRALRAIAVELPELIMLDINMPEMDGYQVCQELKASPDTQNIPVIFISALDDVLDKVKAFKLGAVDYVTKPFQAEEVLARIESQLTISRLRKELETKNSELIAKNEELKRKNQELVNSYERATRIFNTLSDVLPGMVLDEKYKLDEKIGSGGFGSVYKAINIALGKPVAIKAFCPSQSTSLTNIDRFRLEGISSCQINHPNAITIYDFSISLTGIAYLVMELLDGYTLADYLKQKGHLSVNRALEIAIPICQVLAKAHKAGIIHRDIKPENIFLHAEPNGEVIKVLDFGIAKLLGTNERDNMDTAGLILGTPAYLALERLNGVSYDGRSDVYSLGVMLYLMLTGQLPFSPRENSIVSLIYMYMTQDPTSMREINPAIPKVIEDLVMRTLSKDPGNRPTAQELESELIDLQIQSVGTLIYMDDQETASFIEMPTLDTIHTETTEVIERSSKNTKRYQEIEIQNTQVMGSENSKNPDSRND